MQTSGNSEPALSEREWLVVCLCAEWCGTCRDYRSTFEAIAPQFPDAGFVWIDIEDNASWLGELDVEQFPTMLIQRADLVLFYGPMLPHPGHLSRMLESFREQTPDASHHYAHATAERREWQSQRNLRAVLRERCDP